MNHFFKDPQTVLHMREGPLGQYIDSYAAEIRAEGYAHGTSVLQIRLVVSDHLKTYFFERRADRYRRGPIGKGSIHELCRPQTAHRHSVWGWAELGEVISGTP